MNKKFYFTAAIAFGVVALSSCSSEEYLGQESVKQEAQRAILFQTLKQNVSRATSTGGDAADLLNKHFRIYGSMHKHGAVTTPFDNYILAYNGQQGSDSTNVAGWTYLSDVDGSHLYSKGINPALQEIKYWDLDAEKYDFVAFSGLDDNKRIASDASNTIAVNADNQEQIFFSNRVTATYAATATGKTPNAQYGNAYDGTSANVLFTFKRLTSKVRVGLYETIPGYAVKNVRFYYDDNYLAEAGTSAKTNLGLHGKFPVSGNFTISYDNNNAGIVSYDGSETRENFTFGQLDYTTAPSSLLSGDNLNADGTTSPAGEPVFLGNSAAHTTFAKVDGNDWQTILPYPENDQRIVLRVDFDLVPNDGSQSIINVKGASAVIPLEYCQWQANTAYTYIFKISDKTNGTTGPTNPNPPDPDIENPDPQPPVQPGLYPITFDANVSSIEDFSQETITGITSLGGDAITSYVEGSNVVNNDEYLVGDNIIVSSPSHGRWTLAYSNSFITEQQVADNNTFTYTVLAGEATADKTIDQNSTSKAQFLADKAGWYIVCLRYLPTGKPDIEANYRDVFKVIKVN